MKFETVELVAHALNNARVPYLVVGGLAVVAHGYPRSTQDIDLIIRLEPDTIRAAFAALASLGYRPIVPVTADQFADASQRARWAREKNMTVLSFYSDEHSHTPVDVFASEPFDFAREYAAALVHDLAPGVTIRVVGLPALIGLKRGAGRPQDLADIAELRLLHGDRCDA